MKRPLFINCLLLIFFALMFFSIPVNAQKAGDSMIINGAVADSITREPLHYVTINLRTNQNVEVKSVLTGDDGSFKLEALQSLKYRILFTAIGYHPKIINVNTGEGNRNLISLDTIYISANVKNLKEVIVMGARPIIRQQADRIIYDLQADPESKGSNLLTMIRKVPFLSLDGNNNLLLKGKTSFKVLINGKPSGMADNNLKALLQSMPASTIQSIEVITNPSSKYDAEGLAGIINIVTNKKTDNGFEGNLNVNEDFPAGGPGIGTSFSVKQGRFGMTGYGGADASQMPASHYLNSRNTFGKNPEKLIQNGITKSTSRTGYFGTDLNYEIDSLNMVSVQFSINGSHNNGKSNQSSLLTNNDAGLIQSYDLDNAAIGSGNGIDAGINYQMGFQADKNRLLTFSYRYYDYNNDQNNNMDISNPFKYNTLDYRQYNHTSNLEQTFQVDYVHPLKKFNIIAGIKGILRDNKSNFRYLQYNPVDGQFDFFADFSDQFNYNQNVFSAYNSYLYSVKSWTFSAGLRAEQTIVDADFMSAATKVNQNLFNLIPVVSANKEFFDKSSISFGFNQRIKRPNIRKLNPFVDRSNPDFISSGNPDLRPVLVNNLLLAYNRSKKLSLTIALSYSFINNIDLRIFSFDTITHVTTTTYQNTGKADASGIDFNLTYPFSNNWNFSVNGNVSYLRISGLVNNDMIYNNNFTTFIAASSAYKFRKGWRLNAGLNITGRNLTNLQSTANAFMSTSMSMSKELIKNKLSFSVAVNNPFNHYRHNVAFTKGPDFIQLNSTQDYFRSFRVSANYNFGKLKQAIKKNKRRINNDDVSK